MPLQSTMNEHIINLRVKGTVLQVCLPPAARALCTPRASPRFHLAARVCAGLPELAQARCARLMDCSLQDARRALIGQDQDIVHFKIRTTTQLKKLMEAYCAGKSLQMDQTRFLFGGNRLRDTQTPGELLCAICQIQTKNAIWLITLS